MLLTIVRHLGFLSWLQNWVQSFLTERYTTLLVNNIESPPFPTHADLQQGSPLFPILFLLYNEELIRLSNRPSLGVYSLGFVDDVNILAYSKSTEQNCATLSQIHKQCQFWADKHGMAFVPQKYELIHFTTSKKRHNLKADI
jgi:hypothetical protein